jgi:hypothetical protein
MFNHCEKSLFKQWKSPTILVSATELTELIYNNDEIKNELLEYISTLKIKIIDGNIKLVKK